MAGCDPCFPRLSDKAAGSRCARLRHKADRGKRRVPAPPTSPARIAPPQSPAAPLRFPSQGRN